jgi:hypothetical protein
VDATELPIDSPADFDSLSAPNNIIPTVLGEFGMGVGDIMDTIGISFGHGLACDLPDGFKILDLLRIETEQSLHVTSSCVMANTFQKYTRDKE